MLSGGQLTAEARAAHDRSLAVQVRQLPRTRVQLDALPTELRGKLRACVGEGGRGRHRKVKTSAAAAAASDSVRRASARALVRGG